MEFGGWHLQDLLSALGVSHERTGLCNFPVVTVAANTEQWQGASTQKVSQGSIFLIGNLIASYQNIIILKYVSGSPQGRGLETCFKKN